MTVVMKIALNAVNYVIAALQTYYVLPASVINIYQRNAFFQIADVLSDFMIIILFLLIARVIIFRRKFKK